jgi:aspartyl-tRNA(Asn)/glutamyl-tRNA(Gln) amidotransferase subunit C
MAITLDEVRHVAQLARLELDEDELGQFQGELNALLGHIQEVQSLGLIEEEMDEPWRLAPSGRRFNVWAPDDVFEGLVHADALRSAPRSRAGLYIVPTIIEG